MAEEKEGCVKPAKGPIVPSGASSGEEQERPKTSKEAMMTVRVGQEAVDFEANAYLEGVGFQPIRLSDHKGKWIVVCFYPGDFTFV